MGLLSKFKRKADAPASGTRPRTPPPQDPATVETLRTRARRRLIGAAVLVGGAVLGLPALFDAPPRAAGTPLAVRMPAGEGGLAPVVIRPDPPAAESAAPSGRDAFPTAVPVAPPPAASAATGPSATAIAAGTAVAVAGAVAVAARADDGIITEPKTDPAAEAARVAKLRKEQQAAREREQQRDQAAAQAAREKARQEREKAARLERERQDRLEQARADKAEKAEKAEKERAAARAEKAREERKAAQARAEKAEKAEREREARKAAATREAERSARRYVVQVGSYAESRAVKEARQRIGRLGLDSHEQKVETSSGARTRVRLGPYASREEAARAASRLKAAGMSAAVLPL